MRQKEAAFDLSRRVFDPAGDLLPLFFGDRGAQVLDFDQSLARKDGLCDVVDAGHPGVADQLWAERSAGSR